MALRSGIIFNSTLQAYSFIMNSFRSFGGMFKSLGFDIIVCGKVRNGATRIVRIQDGNPDG